MRYPHLVSSPRLLTASLVAISYLAASAAGDHPKQPYNGAQSDETSFCASTLDTSLAPGELGSIYAMAVFEGDLIVGGNFTSIAGVPAARVARWDGEHWHALGDNQLSGSVFALAVYDGELYAAGMMSAVNHLARWDGKQWHPIGEGLTGPIPPGAAGSVMTVHDGLLYIGGRFTAAGGAPASCIAVWDGRTLRGVDETGSGPNNTVFAITFHEGDLIAGGAFGGAGGVGASRLARWDGQHWHAFDGFNPCCGSFFVDDLLSLGDQLYVAGRFSVVDLDDGTIHRGLARWDGEAWHPLGAGVTGGFIFSRVYQILAHRGELFIGGNFDTVDEHSANFLARWDGAQWSPLDDGLSSTVRAMIVHDDAVFAGAQSLQVDGAHVERFARWHSPAPPRLADLNCDGVIDSKDLAMLLNAWGECPGPFGAPGIPGCTGDLNQSGIVDGEDLLILLQHWDP